MFWFLGVEEFFCEAFKFAFSLQLGDEFLRKCGDAVAGTGECSTEEGEGVGVAAAGGCVGEEFVGDVVAFAEEYCEGKGVVDGGGVADCGEGVVDRHAGSFDADGVVEPGGQILVHVLGGGEEGLICGGGVSGFDEGVEEESEAEGCGVYSGVGVGDAAGFEKFGCHFLAVFVSEGEWHCKGDASGAVGVYAGADEVVGCFHAFACGVGGSVGVAEFVKR